MTDKIAKIKKSFGNKVQGTKLMEQMVYKTVAIFPDDIINLVTKSCWFLGSFEDAWAYTFKGNDLKDKFLIFISDDLLTQPEFQIKYTIAHEIGHVVLKHENAVDIQVSDAEVKKQEKEAKEFALKYLKSSLSD